MTLIQVAEQGIGESMAFLSERTEKKHCLKPILLMSIITPVDWGTGMVQRIVLIFHQFDQGYRH